MMEKAHFVENRVFRDKRGTFSPLDLTKLDKNWLQSNISVNPRKYTLRGLHFQKNEYAQAKLIKVISGRILDFVVDLSHRLADEPDYDLYLRPRLDDLLCYLESLDYSMPRDEASGIVEERSLRKRSSRTATTSERMDGYQQSKRDPHV